MCGTIEHTFVVCAYKQSEYLEDCIISLKKQTIPSNIILCTSTPNDYINDIAGKYSIEVFINEDGVKNGSNIAKDWNFALSKSSTEIKNDLEVKSNKLLKIKRILLSPLKNVNHWSSIRTRRKCLSFGNPICCPSVSFCLDNLKQPIFESGMKSNIDWDAWEKLSKENGEFAYVPKILMSHRIHAESTTTAVIAESSGRSIEDYNMLCKFWPEWVSKLIEFFYKDSEKQNGKY